MQQDVFRDEQPTQQNATIPYAPAIWEAAFLRVLARRGNVTDACTAADIERSTAYRRRDDYPEFKALWEEALKQASDSLEDVAWKRATEGTEKPVWYKGNQVGTELEYSDALLMFLLKGNKPEKFKERMDVTSDDKPLAPVAIVKMPIDEL